MPLKHNLYRTEFAVNIVTNNSILQVRYIKLTVTSLGRVCSDGCDSFCTVQITSVGYVYVAPIATSSVTTSGPDRLTRIAHSQRYATYIYINNSLIK